MTRRKRVAHETLIGAERCSVASKISSKRRSKMETKMALPWEISGSLDSAVPSILAVDAVGSNFLSVL